MKLAFIVILIGGIGWQAIHAGAQAFGLSTQEALPRTAIGCVAYPAAIALGLAALMPVAWGVAWVWVSYREPILAGSPVVAVAALGIVAVWQMIDAFTQ